MPSQPFQYEKTRNLSDDITEDISIRNECGLMKKFNTKKRVDSIWSDVSSSHRDLTRDQVVIYLTILNVFVTFGISQQQPYYKSRERIRKSFVDLVARTKCHVRGEDLIRVLKNANDILFAEMVRDEEARSEVVEGGLPWYLLYTGYLLRVIRRFLARRDSTAISFVTSLVMAKVGWPKLGDESLWKATVKSAAAYGKRVIPYNERSAAAIVASSRRVFGRFNADGESKRFPLMKIAPSTNASLLAPRKDGGSYSLFEALPEFEEVRGKWRGEMKIWDVNESFKDLCSRFDHYRQELFSDAYRAAISIDQALRIEGFRQPVKMMFLPEPGKFRCIGLGPGVQYTALQPLQGQLLSAWKRTEYSTMIGDLDEKVQRIVTVGRKLGLRLLVSGDYEAATDMLSSWSGAVALRALGPHPLVPMCENTLYNNLLQFPAVRWTAEREDYCKTKKLEFLVEKVKGLDGRSKKVIRISAKQINGQPMGHPCSFPLLCVVNLACYEEAVRRYCRHVESRDYVEELLNNVLINGDDILFAANDALLEYWRREVSCVGLVPSVGKNYVSSTFCMINSKRYLVSPAGKIRLCSYLNLRLISGISLKKGESSATPDMIGRELNVMFESCDKLTGWLPAVFSRFSYPELKKVNWFLPPHLGGFGVDPKFAPGDNYISPFQRKLAALYVCDPQRMSLFRMDREGLIDVLPSFKKKFAKLAPHVRPVRSDEAVNARNFAELPFDGFDLIREELEPEVGSTDEWIVRLLAIGKAVVGESVTTDPPLLKAVRQSVKTRLEGMTDEGIKKWWVVEEVPRPLATLPPLSKLKIPKDTKFIPQVNFRPTLVSLGRASRIVDMTVKVNTGRSPLPAAVKGGVWGK